MCMYSCRCPLQLHLHICKYKTVGVFYNCMCTPVFIKLSICFSRSCRDVVNYIVIIMWWQCRHCRYVDDDDVDDEDEDDICSKPLFGRNPSQVLSGDPNFQRLKVGEESWHVMVSLRYPTQERLLISHNANPGSINSAIDWNFSAPKEWWYLWGKPPN